MRKRKTFVGMAIFIAVLILGVGYAAVSGIPLNLSGTANVKANADFSVVYDTTHTVALSTTNTVQWSETEAKPVVEGSYTDESNAVMTVYLDTDNRSASATYKIVNNSEELNATVAAEVTADFATEYADYLSVSTKMYSDEDCTTELGNTELGPEDVAYLKVEVTLETLPVEDITSATFGVTVNATPVATELAN